MNKLVIKRQNDVYLVECNDALYERRCLDEVFEDTFVNVDYRVPAANILSALFQTLDELVIIEENGNWLAFAPSADTEKYRVEHAVGVDVESYSLPEALISLLLSSLLYNVARRLPTLE